MKVKNFGVFPQNEPPKTQYRPKPQNERILSILVGGESIMDIGASIKRLRKSHGETQQQLGEAVGVVQQSVAAWESNRCMPDIASLVAIATHYGTSTDSILGLTEEPNYLFDAEGMQSYRNDVALADRLPADIRDGVLALIRLERVKYGR